MQRHTRSSRVARLVMATMLGGSVFQLSGCDPAVRDTLLDGLEATSQSLIVALNSAFFVSLADDNSGLTTTP